MANSRSSTKSSLFESARRIDDFPAFVYPTSATRNSPLRPLRCVARRCATPRASRAGRECVDQPTVRLELRLTGTARPDPAARALQVRPHPPQPRENVLELRQLDLHLRLGGPRPRREDVQDQLGPVYDPDLERVLEVLPLRGRELLVEDDEGGAGRLDQLLQLHDLPFTDVVLGMRRVEPLNQRADDDRAGGVRQPGQLVEVFFRRTGRLPLHRGRDQYGPLARRLRRDRFAYETTPFLEVNSDESTLRRWLSSRRSP